MARVAGFRGACLFFFMLPIIGLRGPHRQPPIWRVRLMLVCYPENILQKFRVFRGASRPGLKPRVYRAQFLYRALRRGSRPGRDRRRPGLLRRNARNFWHATLASFQEPRAKFRTRVALSSRKPVLGGLATFRLSGRSLLRV